MHDIETLVIGAGVVGLAIARALALAGREVMVIERHSLIGSETSSRNSEVIHAGIYYPQNSLKSLLCVAGKQKLYSFCKESGVPFDRIGKLIVATNDSQVAQLEDIKQNAIANGVKDLVLLPRNLALEYEPNLSCRGALFSPSTGIIDSHAFMLALQGGFEAENGQVVLQTSVDHIEQLPSQGFKVSVKTKNQENYHLTTKELVLAAGHASPRLAKNLLSKDVPKPFMAKGNYFKLLGKTPFSKLIYPVPEPGGLGVHLTLDLQNQARFGPDVEWIDKFDYAVDPARGEEFYQSIRSYWPDLPDNSLIPDYAGIRPKIVNRGEDAADFRIDGMQEHGIDGMVALFGIESPGLTASLAIADRVLQKLEPSSSI